MTYATDLPSEQEISERLEFALSTWRSRNDHLTNLREAILGNNTIDAPASLRYKIRTIHTYLMSAMINEKVARYLHQPQIQVIPTDITPEARTESSNLEKAIKAAFTEMERHGDGDVWSRIVMDAILLDSGVERIERAPAAFWPEALKLNDETQMMEYIMEGDKLDAYKKENGVPIRSVYVPLENFFPIYEGPTPVETFEYETRSLRSVLINPTFDTNNLRTRIDENIISDPRVQIHIIHYCNQQKYAYYALAAKELQRGQARNQSFTPIEKMAFQNLGAPILLHSYDHNLGQVIYNIVGGRYGGWKTETNRIEGINKGMMELNARADEVFSQVLTNIRARYWPSLQFKIDPDRRPQTSGSPKPPSLKEGEDIALFINESLGPIFQSQQDDSVVWTLDVIREQLGRLGGSPVVFGGRQPGVDTGYHQQLQITQSEHLDEKIEQHLSLGAVHRAVLLLKHIKAEGQEVFVNHIENSIKGKTGHYLSIKPSQLVPLPRLDASVRKPRPVDFAASLRAAREASDDRGGKGPLLDDDTILQDLLGQEAPDDIKRKIRIQSEENKILQSGVLTQKIIQLLNLQLATTDTPNPGDVTGNDVDPSLQAALQSRMPGTRTPGQSIGNDNGGPSLQTGVPTGQAQPEANAGLEIANTLR